MTIQISEEILSIAEFTPQEFLIEIATHLYNINKLTMGQARKLANLDQISFQQELSKRDIYIKYSVVDFENDLKSIQELNDLKH